MAPLIGAHVSAAGGLEKVFARAEEIGAEAIQMFGSSPRQWAVVLPSLETTKKFKDAHAHSRVQQVFLHAPYLVNIGHPDRDMRAKSITALAGHLEICRRLGADGLIFHIGSGKGVLREEARRTVVESMRSVLERVSDAQLVIENSAGEGDKIGSTSEEIAQLIALVGSKRVGVCIDTAHAFASGVIDEYTPEKVRALFDVFQKTFGFSRLAAFHVNDSKVPSGAKKDRHENIGEGYIGINGFRAFMNEPRIKNRTLLLEVPGFDGNGPDKKNVDILRLLG